MSLSEECFKQALEAQCTSNLLSEVSFDLRLWPNAQGSSRPKSVADMCLWQDAQVCSRLWSTPQLCLLDPCFASIETQSLAMVIPADPCGFNVDPLCGDRRSCLRLLDGRQVLSWMLLHGRGNVRTDRQRLWMCSFAEGGIRHRFARKRYWRNSRDTLDIPRV